MLEDLPEIGALPMEVKAPTKAPTVVDPIQGQTAERRGQVDEFDLWATDLEGGWEPGSQP